MLSINTSSFDAAKFEFHFKTSDGDKIDLKLTDSLVASDNVNRNSTSTSMEYTLSHKYSYEYSYKGNGLSKQDIKEIKEALKKVQPMLDKFLKAKEEHKKEVANFANNLKSILPNPKDENHELAIKHHTLKSFDEILKEANSDQSLKKAKELFDRLFSKKFEIFA